MGKILTASTARSTDGGTTFPTKSQSHMVTFESILSSSAAHVAVSGAFDLVEGKSYVFGMSLGGGVGTANVSCTGTVTVAHVP